MAAGECGKNLQPGGASRPQAYTAAPVYLPSFGRRQTGLPAAATLFRSAMPTLSASAQRRRQEILAAATSLFGRKGWPATTSDEIAAQAGVTKRTMYKYFPSKQALLFEVGQSFVEVNRPRVAELAALQGTPTERLRAYVLGYVRVALASQQRFAVFLEEVKHLDDEQMEYFRKTGGEWIELLREIVQDGKASGDFDRTLDTSVATFTILSMVRGMIHWARPGAGMTKVQLAEHTARLVLDGLGVRDPAEQ